MNTIQVSASRTYPVHIGRNLLPAIGQSLAGLIEGRNTVIISDQQVWDLYGQQLTFSLEQAGFAVHSFRFSPGEGSKSAENFLAALHAMAEAALHREDCVIALGGGVTGDLAGFAAACYMRGISYVQVPTSLLAMVDASVGGKTAINMQMRKNLCGAFHQPAAVFCDIDTLNTLPQAVFIEGCAEIIKYAVLFDAALFSHLEEKGLDFDREYVISRCIAHKAQTVQADEFDTGKRQLLNFGHTVGHAIEKASAYEISHGRAVAIGMAIATRGATEMGLCSSECCERIVKLIEKFGLPVHTEFSVDTLHRYALEDKKANAAFVPMILPEQIGLCRILPLAPDALRERICAGIKRTVTVSPGTLAGSINAPPSKSCAHRMLICAALAQQPSEILCGPTGRDVEATVRCLQALGARITETASGFRIEPLKLPPDSVTLPCGESGSTLRFLLPVVGALGITAAFQMDGRLRQRPLSPLWEEMERMGCRLHYTSENTLLCEGQLRPGVYKMDGSVSSQFISGLLMAMPLLGDSRLDICGEPASRPYIGLTLDILKNHPSRVEGDWSNAAFWLAANALGSEITVEGLQRDSRQGDRVITQRLSDLKEHCHICAADIPDLIPILALVAAANQGAVFTDVARLRMKESDRVAAILQMLSSLGGKAEADENTLTVFPATFTGGTVDSHNDHRIAMTAAIAALICQKPVTVVGADCVQKSYPHFWADFQQLGGKLWEASTVKT